MCGRTACSLDPVCLQKACSYKDRHGNAKQPTWFSPVAGQQYFPSYNMSPGQCTPVLISASNCSNGEADSDRVLQPMLWGLVPSWHRGDVKKFGYKMSNCRSESLREKRSFVRPLESGQRCVVLADGFYEWKTSGGLKQPYYIYSRRCSPEGTAGGDHEETVKDEIPSGNDCESRGLLKMAGLFDVCKCGENGEPIYSYTVITVESSTAMSHIHHRMPAILESPDEVRDWLDCGHVPAKQALQLIHSSTDICCHPVSTEVNNSRNNSANNIVPVTIKKPQESASGKFMKAWMSKGNKEVKDKINSSLPVHDKNENIDKLVSSETVKTSPGKSEINSKKGDQPKCGPLDMWVKRSPVKRKAESEDIKEKKVKI